MKTHSTFFGSKISDIIHRTLENNGVASEKAADFIAETSYWKNLTYDELQQLMFAPTLKRSWFVLSDGDCPSCKNSVPMYNWLHDAQKTPWKLQCPHCGGLFPKNNFKAFYDSGLDEAGVFQYDSADDSLLVNEEGGIFGVDDGNGYYSENGRRYLFIATYLAHSHWTNLIVKGIVNLSFSYVLTRESDYARRALILLDSVARFFPDFDFYTQGIMYEKENCSHGYVTYWVNSCNELRYFALAYDQIYESILSDKKIEGILKKDIKTTCLDIERRIFHDALKNTVKILTNPPVTPITRTIIKSVLDYTLYKDEVLNEIDDIINKATFIDGMSGEKGLAGYAAISPRAIADMLCLYTNTDDGFIHKILKRYPVLYKTYRFHIDTWYNSTYYPGIGDSSVFALPITKYPAIFSPHTSPIEIFCRSGEWFAWKLYEYYGDADFAKIIFLSNNNSIKGCFESDLYIEDPILYQKYISNLIIKTGSGLNQKSIFYPKWRMSILHTGTGRNKAMIALPYESGANHCHHDALSLHYFAKGLNITPDFGYPPVNYGGWMTKEVEWYRHPSSHNSVVIDGQNHTNLPSSGFYRYPEHGKNLLSASNDFVSATYCDAKEYTNTKRYERLVVLIDISETDCYCVDISRTDGGHKHTKFLRSSYSSLSSFGLDLKPTGEYLPMKTFMRNFNTDINPKAGWSVDFKIHDEYKILKSPRDIHLKYTGLTESTSVSLCDSWVDITKMTQFDNKKTGNNSIWIPTVMEQKNGPQTQFTGILEVYEDTSKIISIRRLEMVFPGEFDEAIEVMHDNNVKDIIIAADPYSTTGIRLKEYSIDTDALLAVIRYKNSLLQKIVLHKSSYMKIDGTLHPAIPENN